MSSVQKMRMFVFILRTAIIVDLVAIVTKSLVCPFIPNCDGLVQICDIFIIQIVILLFSINQYH